MKITSREKGETPRLAFLAWVFLAWVSLILCPLYVEVTPPSLFSFAFIKHHYHHHLHDHHHHHHYIIIIIIIIIIITNAVAFVRIACLFAISSHTIPFLVLFDVPYCCFKK